MARSSPHVNTGEIEFLTPNEAAFGSFDRVDFVGLDGGTTDTDRSSPRPPGAPTGDKLIRVRRASGDVGTGDIEFLAPNETAFGSSDVADFVGFDGSDVEFGEQGPRSKWLPAVAGVVITGLIGAGVIAAAPWDSDPASAPTTTTVATSTTAPTSTSVPPFTPTPPPTIDVSTLIGPGFVLDESSEMTIVGAYDNGWRGTPDVLPQDRLEVWATVDARRSSGTWVAIATQASQGDPEQLVRGGERLVINGNRATISISNDGVISMTTAAVDGTPIVVRSFGLDLDDLSELIPTAVGPAGFEYSGLGVMTDLGMIRHEFPLWSGALSTVGIVQPEISSHFAATDGSRAFLDISAGSGLDDTFDVGLLLVEPIEVTSLAEVAALDEFANRFESFVVGRNPLGDSLVASWNFDGRRVLATWYGTDVPRFIGVLAAIRPARLAEWGELVEQTVRGQITLPTNSSSTRSTVFNLGRGTPTDERFWNVDVLLPSGEILFNTDMAYGYDLLRLSAEPSFEVWNAPSVTFIVGSVAWPSAVTTMRVTVEGQKPVNVPLVQLDSLPVAAAAWAFSENSTYTVEFV